MDPLGTVQTVISAVRYLYTAYEKVKENSKECKCLCDHVTKLLGVIESEYKNGLPSTLAGRLEELVK